MDKYKEALERARITYKDEDRHLKATLERIFPELKESGDERIRKAIVATIHLYYGEFLEDEAKEMIAWLEKQGETSPTLSNSLNIGKNEQKSADKVEPKFKVNDWIVNNISKDVFLIKSINNGYCTLEDIKGNNISPCLPPCESESHLWTIQDAKDGDVLNSPSHHLIWIHKDIQHHHACVNMNYVEENFFPDGFIVIPTDVCPATKDEQTILFARMKEAGYEWDAEKKELRKIEQNPAENEELTEFDKAVGVSIGTWNPKTPEQIQAVKAVSKKLLKLAKKQINDERNPAWSEEDEHRVKDAIYFLDTAKKHYASTVELDACIDWLKALKQRYTWKPSDEQIKALADALSLAKNCGEENAFDLRTLYEQLKKLREK